MPHSYASLVAHGRLASNGSLVIRNMPKPLDLSKLESPVEVEEKNEVFKIKGNDLMFGDKIIANKMDFETNKSLLETQEEISPVMAHNKGYKFEMLYTRPSHPVLFAIDPENGNIYVVDVKPNKDESPEDEETISNSGGLIMS